MTWEQAKVAARAVLDNFEASPSGELDDLIARQLLGRVRLTPPVIDILLWLIDGERRRMGRLLSPERGFLLQQAEDALKGVAT